MERLWSKAVPEVAQYMVYVGGVGNLIEGGAVAGAVADEERGRLRALLSALETKRQLVESEFA